MSPRSGSITTSPQAIKGRDARKRAEIDQIYSKLNKIFFITEEPEKKRKNGKGYVFRIKYYFWDNYDNFFQN